MSRNFRLEVIEGLGERRFRVFRRLFFPRSTLTVGGSDAIHVREIERTTDGVGEVAKSVDNFSISRIWYGFDPIHIKRRAERAAWPELLVRLARQ